MLNKNEGIDQILGDDFDFGTFLSTKLRVNAQSGDRHSVKKSDFPK